MTTRPKNPPVWADSAEAWSTQVVHDVTCPSGRKVSYRDLTTMELAMLDELPKDLIEMAAAEWGNPGGGLRKAAEPILALTDTATDEQRAGAEEAMRAGLRALWEVNRHLVAAALVEPKMTVEQLANVPNADVQMLALLINRATDEDAEGKHVGVVPLDTFRAALQAHGIECAPDCQTCAAVRREVSTVRHG